MKGVSILPREKKVLARVIDRLEAIVRGRPGRRGQVQVGVENGHGIVVPTEDLAAFRERMFAFWKGFGHPEATCEMFLRDAFNTDGYVDAVSRALRVMGNFQGKSILDVGCGWGGLSRVLASCGARVTMIDPNPPHVEVARARVGDGNGIVASGSDLLGAGLADETFDRVFVYSVIEHVGLPENHRGDAAPVLDIQGRVISEAARVLKPGGYMMVSTGNHQFPFDGEVQIWFFHYLPKPVQLEMLQMLGRSADRYGLLTWPQLLGMAQRAGLELVSVETCETDGLARDLERWMLPLMSPEARDRSQATFEHLRQLTRTDPNWMPMWHAFFRKPAARD